MAYTWTPPRLQVGEIAKFYDHRGNLKVGECCLIETRYTRAGVAWHSYSMLATGHRRRTCISESNLILPAHRKKRRHAKT